MPGGRRKRSTGVTTRGKKVRTEEDVEIVQLAGQTGQESAGSTDSSGPSTTPASQGKNKTPVPTQHTPSLVDFVDFEKVISDSEISLQNHINSQEVTLNADSANEILKFTGGEETLRLGGEDMSSHVPHQLCQKIWSHQYININLLLKGNVELQDFCSGGLLHITDRGQIETRPKTVKEKVASIEKWTDAFLIFTSIYLKKYPDKTQDLLQYMNIIREAASRSPPLSWRTYDEQFRLRQSTNPQPWGKLNSDLWLRVMTVSASAVQHESLRVSKAHCLDFNNGFCPYNPCKFAHNCSNCGGSNHGRQACFKLMTPNNPHPFRGNPGFRPYRFTYSARGRGRPFTRRGNQHQ